LTLMGFRKEEGGFRGVPYRTHIWNEEPFARAILTIPRLNGGTNPLVSHWPAGLPKEAYQRARWWQATHLVGSPLPPRREN
jgi:hypothetical protein